MEDLEFLLQPVRYDEHLRYEYNPNDENAWDDLVRADKRFNAYWQADEFLKPSQDLTVVDDQVEPTIKNAHLYFGLNGWSASASLPVSESLVYICSYLKAKAIIAYSGRLLLRSKD